MRAPLGFALVGVVAVACSQKPSRTIEGTVDASDASSVSSGPPVADASATTADLHVPDAAGGTPVVAPPQMPDPSFDEIVNVLFADKASTAPILAACPASLPADARIRCLYDERYKGDAKATSIAHELYVKWRIVAGVEVAHTMNGGYRGMIRLEPAVPVGADRKHLEWVAGAMADFDVFFTELEKARAAQSDAGGRASGPKPYRFRPITLRFMRSVAARTPAAYAHDWTVAYNFVGTLNISADAVRETMFHEIFHLNDAAHGEWSPGALGAVFDVVAKKCGTAIPCLAPYTPNDTIVRGGTYYSFQPGNGVMEYAAELALRYYREQRAALRSLPKVKAFKCGPPENAKAWALMRDEFFGGVDAVPACP
jgi:hypothetical protein